MRLRLLVTVSVLAVLAAACTGEPPAPGEDGAVGGGAIAPDTLLLGTASGPLVVNVPAGSVVFDGPGAVASLGGAWVLSATVSGDSTALRTVDEATGVIVSTTRVSGTLDPRIVSESGRAVAMMEPLPKGWEAGVPLPRERTTIVVADPTGERATQTFDLRGNYEPEAFSTDDGSLFMIQHLPAEAPTVYRVTLLDLQRGKVRPVFGPYKGPPERMPGTRLEQLLAPNAQQLYTLYTSSRPGYAPHGAPVAENAAVSFVHVLSLDEGWAHCVGLPRSMWDRPAAEQAMATTPDGSYLYVIDAGRGLVAAMHTESLRVRTAPLSLSVDGEITRTAARVSPDGSTLFVATAGDDGSTVTAVDARTFDVIETWGLDGNMTGLGLSDDGARLYVALDDRIAVVDATTGAELAAVPVASSDPIMQVTPLAG
jgi:hypothetical protein